MCVALCVCQVIGIGSMGATGAPMPMNQRGAGLCLVRQYKTN